jgi:hypothetical protein
MEGIPADNKPKVPVPVASRRQIAGYIQAGLENRQPPPLPGRERDTARRELTWRVQFERATAVVAPFHTFEVETTPATACAAAGTAW